MAAGTVAGTLALVMLIWHPPVTGGPNYSRSVLIPPAPGESADILPPGTPGRDYNEALYRIRNTEDPTGTLEAPSQRKLPARTLSECRAWLGRHLQDLEEAAESTSSTIQDARCMVIPPGRSLDVFYNGFGPGMTRLDPFALVPLPQAAPKQVGPDCAQSTGPAWPDEAYEASVEGHVEASCEIYEGPDGYRHNRNCTVVGKRKRRRDHYADLYAEYVADFVNTTCWKGDPAPDPTGKPYTYHFDFTFSDN